MGMFDYVNFKMECPQCGAVVDGFQSKDRECDLSIVEPDDVENLYSSCACGAWLEFYKKKKEKSAPRTTPLSKEQLEALGYSFYLNSL